MWGDGRRETLAAIEEKDRLDPVEDPDGIEDVLDAVRDLSLGRNLNPPQKVLDTIERVHGNLPDEAQPHYIQDRTLLRRMNAARRQFNEWMGRRKRVAEMPSPVEAGFTKYPAKKARKRSRSARKAYEELQEKIGRVRAGANGARGRALKAIGSSVAEQNEKEREAKREERRDKLEKGDIVQFRNPSLRVGRVVRVNKKTVTVEYEREHKCHPLTGEEYDDPMARDRVDLDSSFLWPVNAETLEEAQKQMEEGEA